MRKDFTAENAEHRREKESMKKQGKANIVSEEESTTIITP